MASVLPKTANWFTYFPEDYRWSSAVCGVLGGAPYGGSDIGEVDHACRGLRKQVGDDEAWFEAWRAEGDRVRALGRDAERGKRRFTAAGAFLRAANYYQMAERFRTPKDARALEAYRAGVECFQHFAGLTDRPRIETVEVPYGRGSLPGYFVHAENTDLARPPCVVFFDGLDITKELQYLRGVPDLVRRMRCPFLLTHGADDEQIPTADAQALFDAVGSADKTLRVFTTEEGGSQHCQRDYLTLGNTVIFDWLAEKL
jgi:hypothetical protein